MGYSIEDYARPSVAADVAAFGISSEDGADKRQSKIKKLKLLLIKRGEAPFEGQYALPGGFLRKGETIEQTAMRELEEETGVSNVSLINAGIYSSPDRDPRGWIISSAFIALSNTVSPNTAESSDALQAEWFDLSYSEDESTITLSNGSKNLVIKHGSKGTEENCICEGIAFDHAKIIYDAFARLRDEVLNHDIVFSLLPEKFPISELQQIYESITGTKDAPANFRRKMKGKIKETDFYDEGAQHRPSKLYTKI